jgi:hypothetical protein
MKFPKFPKNILETSIWRKMVGFQSSKILFWKLPEYSSIVVGEEYITHQKGCYTTLPKRFPKITLYNGNFWKLNKKGYFIRYDEFPKMFLETDKKFQWFSKVFQGINFIRYKALMKNIIQKISVQLF